MTTDAPLFPPGPLAAAARASRPVVELDPDVVTAVHRALWFLLPGDDAAVAGTKWTFEIAATRSHALPDPDHYIAWLVTIADRESRRHRTLHDWQRRKSTRHRDSVEPNARARHVAEAMGHLTPDERLALVLRLLVGAPPQILSTALGVTVGDVAGVVNQAIDRLTERCDAPLTSIAALPVPVPVDMPRRVQPLSARAARRSKLNYGWQSNGFPTLTDFDRQGRRRALAIATTAAVFALAIGLWRANPPLRPVLVEPNVATVASHDLGGDAVPTEQTPGPRSGGPDLGGIDLGGIDLGGLDLGSAIDAAGDQPNDR
ncbi:MAG: hypothetical protein HKN26_07645 [Acidimicrobiales bacterium]|nr:hypothetical protein [Acidimicrobiales bacterium]